MPQRWGSARARIQQYYDCKIPEGTVDEKIVTIVKDAVLEYERHMYNHDFHRITYVLDSFIREINKHWVNNIKIAERDDNDALRRQIIIDCFYGIKAISTLLHPIAPAGCEMVREYLNVDERLWSWDYIFEPLDVLMSENHELKFLEPKVDFFKKLDCQFAANE